MIKRWINRAKLAYQRYQAQRDIVAFGGKVLSAGDDPSTVFDGVQYALPMLVPYSLRKQMEANGELDTFIRESYARATNFQFDNPYKKDLPFNPVTEDPLAEWDWSTRRYILENCHGAYNRNPDAKVAINHIANFAIGKGFNLVTYHPEVEAVLKDFMHHPDNRIREYERQVAKDLLIDGEIVARYVVDEDTGNVLLVPYRPVELQHIRTALGNYRQIEEFHFNFHWDEGDYPGGRVESKIVEIPADEILFVAINNRAYELRGRPELYPALPWLKARKDWLENRARINYWLSVILWRVTVSTNNPSVIASVASRWATPPKPGSVSVEHDAVNVQPMNASPNAGEARDDGRQLLMNIAKAFGLPEYMLGDGENANLASASRQQLPAIVKFEDYQRTLIMELWKPMFKKVLSIAIDRGELPIMVQKHNGAGNPIEGEMIPTMEAFDVQYKDIMQEDILKLTQALEKQMQNEFISVRSARGLLGNDPDLIEKEIEEEKEQAMRDIAQGRMMRPPEMRPEALPVGDDMGDDEDETEDETPEMVGA